MDFALDRQAIVDTVIIEERDFATGDCALVEGAVPAPGRRRLLRFDVVIVNRGEADAVIGNPRDPVAPLTAADFEFSPCHGHFHFGGFAEYELRDGRASVGFGHKQNFCIADSEPYGAQPSNGYDCAFQGISSGWGDRYGRTLDGQWVDVTGVPAGDYTLVVRVNQEQKIPERRGGEPNVAEVPVRIP